MRNRSFALVTGASQGLGRVFAHALAARKQNVILVADREDKLESLANELQRSESVFAKYSNLTLLLLLQASASLRDCEIGNFK